MMAAILKSAMLDSDTAILDSDPLLSSLRFFQKHSHSTLTLTQTNSIWLTWRSQPYRILPSWILLSYIQPFCTKKLDSFTLIELDDGSHLEFCHVGFRHSYLGFRYLVIFSQTYSKTLSVYCDFDSNYSNLTETHSFSLKLMMEAIFNFAILNLAILDSVILVFSLKLIHTWQDWFPLLHKKTSLIYSDSTGWW